MATQLASLSSPCCFQQQRNNRSAQCRRVLVVRAAKASSAGKKRLNNTGYIIDNSNSGNIYAVVGKDAGKWTSSPTADRAARQGIGGTQGLLIVAGIMGLVALATLGVASNPGESLQDLASSAAGVDSLSTIAGRLSSSL